MSSQPPPDFNVQSPTQTATGQQPPAAGAAAPATATQLPAQQLPRIQMAKFSWRTYIITVLVFEIVALLLLQLAGLLNIGDIGAIIAILFAVFLFASVVQASVFFINKLYSRFIEKKTIQREINQLQEQLSEDFFTNLIRINFKYIDKYYLQTQVQANRSFILASVAASVSLFIILIGIVMMYYGGNDKLTAAYMTTISGLLGEFISTVFFYLYNRTVLEMSEYHQKLVLTQNVSLALKMAQELPDTDKSKAQVGLIECLSKDINMYLTMQMSKSGHGKEQAPASQNGTAAVG